MKLGEDLDAYFAAKARVHEGFEYTPDWVEIPLDDAREYYWMLVGGEGVGATCVYSDNPFTEKSIEAGKTFTAARFTRSGFSRSGSTAPKRT